MDNKAIYEQKKTSVEAVLGEIRNGDSMICTTCANEPTTLLGNLHTVLDNGVEDLSILMSLTSGMYSFAAEQTYRDRIRIDSQFFGATIRKRPEDIGSFIPANLSTAPFKRAANRSPNVLLASVTPMDEEGYLRTSLTNIFAYYYFAHAEKILLEVNPNLPMVEGTMKVHISKVTALTEVETKVTELPRAAIGEEERAIGEYVAQLIDDGDTVQFGIGGIPDALAESLKGHKDLGIHTEMINSAMGELMRQGVVTNEKKTLHPGRSVAVFAWGDRALYDMMDRSDRFLILDGSYVNDPRVIAQNDHMKSINTAIGVDLTGQIAAETVGYHQYSGSGGQMDTALGASWSKGGLSVIALKSTARGGQLSTITPFLPLGSAVTLSRNIVDAVVTEYGIALLTGRSVRERTENLIRIAHPKFREQLRMEAKKATYL